VVSSVPHCTNVFYGRCLRDFGETKDLRIIPSTLFSWLKPADFSIFIIKNCDERDDI
jgi:hypothetical protein